VYFSSFMRVFAPAFPRHTKREAARVARTPHALRRVCPREGRGAAIHDPIYWMDRIDPQYWTLRHEETKGNKREGVTWPVHDAGYSSRPRSNSK
jgi:hypothetical protein